MAQTFKPSKVDRYWRQFQESLPSGAPRKTKPDWVFSFGSKQHAPELADLVLRGTKTSTASLKWEYDAKGKRIPRVGDLSVITDGAGNPMCVIENTETRVLPLDEVDAAFAFEGGEGDRTLAGWRRMYWDYIVSECARLGREPNLTAPLVCERFRVRYREPLAP